MKKWEILKSENIFSDTPLISINKNKIKTSCGKTVDNYYHISTPDSVIVFTMTADQEIILLHHYRQGIESKTLGVPSGMIDKDETPRIAALRELREETGYTTDNLIEIGEFVFHSNWFISLGHFFLAKDAYFVSTPESHDLEESYVGIFSIAETNDALKSGQFKIMSDALAVSLALQFINTTK